MTNTVRQIDGRDNVMAVAGPELARADAKAISLASDAHAQQISPARELIAHLEDRLTYDAAAASDRFPLKWTILGLALFCGLTWYGIVSLFWAMH